MLKDCRKVILAKSLKDQMMKLFPWNRVSIGSNSFIDALQFVQFFVNVVVASDRCLM